MEIGFLYIQHKYLTEYRKYPYVTDVNMNVAETWLVLNPWLYVSLQDASIRGTAEGIFAPETKLNIFPEGVLLFFLSLPNTATEAQL